MCARAFQSIVGAVVGAHKDRVEISLNTITSTLADAEHAARFRSGDIANWPSFCTALASESNQEDAPAQRVMSRLPEEAQALVRQTAGAATVDSQIEATLQEALNVLIGKKDFYQEQAFVGVELNEEAKGLQGKGVSRATLATVERFNRLVLEAASAPGSVTAR